MSVDLFRRSPRYRRSAVLRLAESGIQIATAIVMIDENVIVTVTASVNGEREREREREEKSRDRARQ